MIDTLLLVAFIIGVAAGGFLIARSPAFWVGLAITVFNAAKPFLMTLIFKRMSPEDEKKYQQTVRQGQEWDPIRKRPREH